MIELSACIEKLNGSDEADRIYAAEDIGYANQAAGVDALLQRLPQERSRAVREAIFGALLQIEDDAVIEGAVGLLASEDSFLRNQAVQLLQARGSRALPFLERAFGVGDQDRRKFVIDVVARLADPQLFDLYHRALQDPDLNVVITAVENLGNTRQTKFREQIENLLAPDAHPMLLSAAIEALAQIGDASSLSAVRRCFGSAAALPAYLQPSYLKLLGTKGQPLDVREIASFASTRSLDAAVLNALTSLRNRYPGTKLPSSLVQPLRDMASRNEPLLAYQAVRLLSAFLPHDAVLDFLARCLDHPEKVIRIGAVQALRDAGDEETEAILRQRLSQETDEEVLQAWNGQKAE